MNLLQRYILGSVSGACAAAVALFVFILLIGNVFRDLLGYLLAGQITPETFAQLLLWLVPFVAVHALPMGMLTGVLLVLGRMSAQQEITAMRAAGLGLGFVARPILGLALLGTVLALAINFHFMPQARTAYRTTLSAAVRSNPMSMIVPRTFIRDFPKVVFYVTEKRGTDLVDVWLWRLDGQKRALECLRARHGEVSFDEQRGVLTLTLREVLGDVRDAKYPENFRNSDLSGAAGSMSFEFNVENIFARQNVQRKTSWLTWRELGELKAKLVAEAAPAREIMRVAMMMQEKAAGACTVLAFVVIAIPLGIRVSRKETMANLALALLLALTYHFLLAIVNALEAFPQLRPDLLLWLPLLLYLGVGGWLARKVTQV